jgi:hypothetical protein
MKLMLPLCAALALALAAPAGASVVQSRWANSDDFKCNHGDPDAPTTISACYRLRDTIADPGPEPGVLTEEAAMAARAAHGRTYDATYWEDAPPPIACGRHHRAFFLVPAYGGGSVLVESRRASGDC